MTVAYDQGRYSTSVKVLFHLLALAALWAAFAFGRHNPTLVADLSFESSKFIAVLMLSGFFLLGAGISSGEMDKPLQNRYGFALGFLGIMAMLSMIWVPYIYLMVHVWP